MNIYHNIAAKSDDIDYILDKGMTQKLNCEEESNFYFEIWVRL